MSNILNIGIVDIYDKHIDMVKAHVRSNTKYATEKITNNMEVAKSNSPAEVFSFVTLLSTEPIAEIRKAPDKIFQIGKIIRNDHLVGNISTPAAMAATALALNAKAPMN